MERLWMMMKECKGRWRIKDDAGREEKWRNMKAGGDGEGGKFDRKKRREGDIEH